MELKIEHISKQFKDKTAVDSPNPAPPVSERRASSKRLQRKLYDYMVEPLLRLAKMRWCLL